MTLYSLAAMQEHNEADYIAQEKLLAFVHGNPDNFNNSGFVQETADFEDFARDLDGSLKVSGNSVYYRPFVKGDSLEVRKLFNRRFNEIIAYHSNLWRGNDEVRNSEYYANRYMRFFQDLFLLYEEFPDITSNKEYLYFLERYSFYKKKADYCYKKNSAGGR